MRAGLGGQNQFVVLDLLRALAATEVFLGHVRGSAFVEYGALPSEQHNLITAALYGLTRLGHEAVMVFFVLSGYLVFGAVISRASAGEFDVTRYVIDRTTRIMIPLIPACILTVVLERVFFGGQIGITQLLLNVVGLNGVFTDTLAHNAPLWTLAYEIWFYVIGGAIGYLWLPRRPLGIAWGVLALGVAVFSVLDAHYLLFWMMSGVVTLRSQGEPCWKWAAGGGTLAIFGILAYELGSGSKSFTSVSLLPAGVAECFICVGVIAAIPWLCTDTMSRQMTLIAKPARMLSAVSFTLYLVHYPVNAAMDRFLPRATSLGLMSLGLFAARIIICLVVAVSFYLAFERNTALARRYIISLMRETASAETV